jgi:hypothetical protein
MKPHVSSVGMTLQDILRTREVGEQVVSHVFENVREPEPDFEAMKRAITAPDTAGNAPGNDDPARSLP